MGCCRCFPPSCSLARPLQRRSPGCRHGGKGASRQRQAAERQRLAGGDRSGTRRLNVLHVVAWESAATGRCRGGRHGSAAAPPWSRRKFRARAEARQGPRRWPAAAAPVRSPRTRCCRCSPPAWPATASVIINPSRCCGDWRCGPAPARAPRGRCEHRPAPAERAAGPRGSDGTGENCHGKIAILYVCSGGCRSSARECLQIRVRRRRQLRRERQYGPGMPPVLGVRRLEPDRPAAQQRTDCLQIWGFGDVVTGRRNSHTSFA